MIASLALALAMQTSPLTVEVKGVPKPPPAPAPAPAQLEAGKQLFLARCAACHGQAGNSDGPVGKALKPTPQRFTDALWGARVTDEEIATAIKAGGAAVKKSPAMPAHKDLNDEQVRSLVAFVRSLRSPYGTASVTVMLADGRDVTVAVDADKAGNANAVVPGVSGKATVLGVVDATGNPICTVEVADAAGARVRCAK